MVDLADGRADAAWDRFLDRYRRLIFSAIRFHAREHDDVMDVFARVCEALRDDNYRRLHERATQPPAQARFSTWLVTVVRNITVDWFRHRDGRRRTSAVVETLSPLRRRIFDQVFVRRVSHLEAYEHLCSEGLAMSFREFLRELSATYRDLDAAGIGQVSRHLGGPPPIEPDELIVELAPDTGAAEGVAAALATLPPEDRLAVELYIVEQLSAVEVAGIVGLTSPKAVYNRVYRALALLREHLERAGIHRADL